eukprot:3893330-Rhodomonas_salina.1
MGSHTDRRGGCRRRRGSRTWQKCRRCRGRGCSHSHPRKYAHTPPRPHPSCQDTCSSQRCSGSKGCQPRRTRGCRTDRGRGYHTRPPAGCHKRRGSRRRE